MLAGESDATGSLSREVFDCGAISTGTLTEAIAERGGFAGAADAGGALVFSAEFAP
jgi:hypothetical protein